MHVLHTALNIEPDIDLPPPGVPAFANTVLSAVKCLHTTIPLVDPEYYSAAPLTGTM